MRKGTGRVERSIPPRYIGFLRRALEQSMDNAPPIMMPLSMTRVILFVGDVERLKNFYRAHFGLPVAEEIAGEWAVLTAGAVELALHLASEPSRNATPADDGTASNAKLVFTVRSGLPELRERLLAAGVKMRDLKRYPGFPQLMCDGFDPEGNVFQLSQPDGP